MISAATDDYFNASLNGNDPEHVVTGINSTNKAETEQLGIHKDECK